MATKKHLYPASLEIDYPKQRDRKTTFLRLIYAIPAMIVMSILSAAESERFIDESGREVVRSGSGIAGGLFVATALLILFRQRYPKWWFDFALELNRFSYRVGSYLFLLTDTYPSTVEHQSVHLNVDYPNVKKDLNKWLPLVKWLLAFPHYVALAVLGVGAVFATIAAWLNILFTGTYPKGLFDYVVGVGRWNLRVNAYAFLLTTDEYPPFSLK